MWRSSIIRRTTRAWIRYSKGLSQNANLPFGRPFDRLTVLSKVEGLTALSKVEGPFDKPFDRLTVLSKVEGLMP
jgi:hypothetical protein